jgi:two-component system, sensor histidine kinase and response regulator
MKTKILLVEDELELQENIAELLSLSNFDVLVASHGKEALQLLSTQKVDVVISDIMMPEMDGFELLKAFREKEYWLETPFIFLTAKMDHADQRRGMEEGAEDFLVKPVKTKELLSSIAIVLEKKKARNQAKLTELKDIFGQQRNIFFHEMSTPLYGVIAALELLYEHGKSLSDEDFKLFTFNALEASRRLDASLIKLRKFQSLDKIQKRLVDIPSMHAFLNEFFQKKCKYSGVQFHVIDDFSVQFTVNHLEEIVDFLLENALKFSPIGEPILVSLEDQVIRIKNSQQAFKSPQQFEVQPFLQHERESQEQQGLGLGSYLAFQLGRINDAVLEFEITSNLAFEARIIF